MKASKLISALSDRKKAFSQFWESEIFITIIITMPSILLKVHSSTQTRNDRGISHRDSFRSFLKLPLKSTQILYVWALTIQNKCRLPCLKYRMGSFWIYKVYPTTISKQTVSLYIVIVSPRFATDKRCARSHARHTYNLGFGGYVLGCCQLWRSFTCSCGSRW